MLFIPFEICLQLINLSNLIHLHSPRKRTQDCYRIFAKFGKIDQRLCDYMAEGFHLNDVKNMEKEQEKKYDRVILEGKITASSRILEVGAGHGKMASYITNKTGCTYNRIIIIILM